MTHQSSRLPLFQFAVLLAVGCGEGPSVALAEHEQQAQLLRSAPLGTPVGELLHPNRPARIAAAAIEGRVTTGNTGVADVVVSDGVRSTTTDAEGKFALAVPAGIYLLSATLANWEFAKSGENPIEVAGGDVRADFYAIGQVLSGSLPCEATTPVVTDGFRTASMILLGGRWRWNISGVPSGQWTLVATEPGMTLIPAAFTNPVTVAADAIGNLDFEAADAGSN